jgi:hypothetical protein
MEGKFFVTGPGEGYNAAKADALALNTNLYCLRVARSHGYLFEVRDKVTRETIGSGFQSRDAWADALLKMREQQIAKLKRMPF